MKKFYCTYICLQNFVGIWSGTGKKEIEIVFDDPDELNSKMILLMGENGSGKSTLISAIHPFSGTFDGRDDNLVISDEDGYKEIHFVKDDSVYIISHHYKRNAKGGVRLSSFISKMSVEDYFDEETDTDSAEELNKNGGVGTFKEKIKEIFDLEEDYFKVGRLASTTTNFVELTAGARKDFIVKHLPDVSFYLKSFENAKARVSECEKNIRYLASEIEKFDSLDDLELGLKKSKSQLKSIEKTSTIISKEEGKIEEKVNNLLQKDSVNQGLDAKKQIELSNKIIKDAASIIESSQFSEIETLEELSELEEEILTQGTEANKTFSVLEERFVSISKEAIKLRNELDERRHELKRLKNTTQEEEDILAQKSESEEKLKDLEKLLKKLQKEIHLSEEDLESFKSVSMKIKYSINTFLNEFKNELQSVSSSLSSVGFEKTLEKISLECSSLDFDIIQYLNILKIENEDNLIEFNERLEETQDKLKNLQNESSNAKLLEKRPKLCSKQSELDSCPFLIKAMDGKKAETKLKKVGSVLEENIKKLKRKISRAESEISTIEDLAFHFSKLNEKVEHIFQAGIEQDILFSFISEKLDLSCSDSTAMLVEITKLIIDNSVKTIIPKLDISKTFEISETFVSIENAKKSINNANLAIDSIKDKKKFLLKSKKELEAKEEALEETEKKKEKVEKELEKAKSELGELRAKMKEIKSVSSSFKLKEKNEEFFEDNSRIFKESEKDIQKLKVLEKELEEKKLEFDEVTKQIEVAKQNVVDYEIKIASLQEYTDRYNSFVENYEKLKRVKDACDPKKGIPLTFMKDFLDEIETITNRLFEVAFSDKFLVEFEINEKEFNIKIHKEDGEILPDVKFASDGQRSLVKTIISLAILSKYTDKFPILALDEIDAVLDENNRTNFARIIDEQISELNLGQVFVISHNQEFRDESISVILFPGHTLNDSEENNVIYSVNESEE